MDPFPTVRHYWPLLCPAGTMYLQAYWQTEIGGTTCECMLIELSRQPMPFRRGLPMCSYTSRSV